MILRILTPEWSRQIPDAEAVFVPAAGKGEFEILRSHAPIVGILGEGLVKWRTATSDGTQTLAVRSGVVRCKGNDNIDICIEQ